MADALNSNTDKQYSLNTVLENQYKYVNEAYTAESIAQEAMERRDAEKARNAIEEGKFGFLLVKDKIERLVKPSDLVMEEFQKVALDTLTGAVQPFFDYLAANEIVFDPQKYNALISGDAKQYYFTANALKDDILKNNNSGLSFNMNM